MVAGGGEDVIAGECTRLELKLGLRPVLVFRWGILMSIACRELKAGVGRGTGTQESGSKVGYNVEEAAVASIILEVLTVSEGRKRSRDREGVGEGVGMRVELDAC